MIFQLLTNYVTKVGRSEIVFTVQTQNSQRFVQNLSLIRKNSMPYYDSFHLQNIIQDYHLVMISRSLIHFFFNKCSVEVQSVTTRSFE